MKQIRLYSNGKFIVEDNRGEKYIELDRVNSLNTCGYHYAVLTQKEDKYQIFFGFDTNTIGCVILYRIYEEYSQEKLAKKEYDNIVSMSDDDFTDLIYQWIM